MESVKDALGGDRSDAELLLASVQDSEAFGMFYDRHVRALLVFFTRRTGDPHAAADLTAETFAQAFLSRSRYRDRGIPARAWLLAIARHQLARFIRRGRLENRSRRRLGLESVKVDELSYERIEELADLASVRSALRDALQSLPRKLAEAVILRVGSELPYSEVAARLSCSEGTARVRVARGLAQLIDLVEVSP